MQTVKLQDSEPLYLWYLSETLFFVSISASVIWLMIKVMIKVD